MPSRLVLAFCRHGLGWGFCGICETSRRWRCRPRAAAARSLSGMGNCCVGFPASCSRDQLEASDAIFFQDARGRAVFI